MWKKRQLAELDTDIAEARAAQGRAQDSIDRLEKTAPEVESLSTRFKLSRTVNGYGDMIQATWTLKQKEA